MTAVPQCKVCSLPASRHHKQGRDFHSHCCYTCRSTDGKWHAQYCVFYKSCIPRPAKGGGSTIPPWRHRSRSPPPHKNELPFQKRRRDGASEVPRVGNPAVRFSLLQNHILRSCDLRSVQEAWRELFVEYNEWAGKNMGIALVEGVFVFPIHMCDRVQREHVGMQQIDTRGIDCRSIRQATEGERIFREGGSCALLQEWIAKQATTVAVLREAFILARQRSQPLGFFCDFGKHRSLATGILFRDIFAPEVKLYSYRDKNWM